MQKLFRLKGRGHGSWLHKNVKVSITNIRRSNAPGVTDYGSFSVVLRHINDTDNNIQVVERFDKNLLLDIDYKLKTQTKEDYLSVLKKSRADDISRGYTSYGPHRDDVLFNWDKKKIKNHGSQGEHKLFLALLKISEHLFISQKTEKTPIFLIDDMFANLDKERSKKLLRFVETFKNKNEQKSQTIITTTNIVNIKENGFFSEYENIKKHHLEEHATT